MTTEEKKQKILTSDRMEIGLIQESKKNLDTIRQETINVACILNELGVPPGLNSIKKKELYLKSLALSSVNSSRRLYLYNIFLTK